jgi:hypothetical protein
MGRARSTILDGKVDMDHGVVVGILDRPPGAAEVTLRTGDLLTLPGNLEMAQVKALPGFGLPTAIPSHGSHQRDARLVGRRD